MARDYPARNYRKIPPAKRLDFLRSYKTAGRPYTSDLQIRRKRFYWYKQNVLAPIKTLLCYVCHDRPEDWHHIVHLSRGGADCPLNLVPLCTSCHKKVHRGDRVRGNRRHRKYVHVPVLVTPTELVVYVPPSK